MNVYGKGRHAHLHYLVCVFRLKMMRSYEQRKNGFWPKIYKSNIGKSRYHRKEHIKRNRSAQITAPYIAPPSEELWLPKETMPLGFREGACESILHV